jgi:hypothetical protein
MIMTSQARIAANQANGRKSRGPVTPRGRAISSMNGLKHGRRSKRIALMTDISYACEERRMRWMVRHDAGDDMEEFLISRNAGIATKLERIDRAEAEAFQSSIENADEKEHDEVLALGKRLFFNRCGSMATYGLGPKHALEVKTSLSGQALEADEPQLIVRKLESSELGTMLLLETWGELRARLEPGKFWQSPDRFRAIRLLGHQPIDARYDDEIAAIFYASAKLEPGQRAPFRELRSDLDSDGLSELRKDVAKRCPELAALKDRAECRQILLDLVDRNVERLEEILATYQAKADTEDERTVAREGFDISPRGRQLHDYDLKYRRALNQGIAVYNKLTGRRTQGGGRRAENGGRRVPPSYGAGPYDFAASRGEPADGTRRVPATMGGAEQGWESVKVEAADVLACQGFLPERYTGIAGAIEDEDAGVPGATAALPLSEEDATPGVSGAPEADACGEAKLMAAPGTACENVTNEPNCDHDVITVQHEESVEVVANSDTFSGLDTLQTNPTPAGGGEACGIGGLHDPTAPTSKEQERRRASMDRMRREWMRLRAAQGVGARERTRTLGAGVTSGGGLGLGRRNRSCRRMGGGRELGGKRRGGSIGSLACAAFRRLSWGFFDG